MLFGHQDDANRPSAPASAPSLDAPQDPVSTGTNPLAVDPATGVSLPATAADTATPVESSQDEQSVLDQPSAAGYDTVQPSFASDPAPTTPFGSDQASAPVQAAPAVQQTADATGGAPMAHLTPAFSDESAAAPQPDPVQPPQPTPSNDYTTPAPAPATALVSDDLLDIKQQALSQLGPLVSQLEQSPEEKFRTTMMLIQTTDSSSLLKDAYDAAQSIPDDKVRAQALLDIVNEINYFTQQPATDTTQTM